MDCKKSRELLPAHVDQELGLLDAIELDKHLKACPACNSEFVRQNALRVTLKKNATYFQAPSHLESRVKAALPAENEHLAKAVKRSWKWAGPGNWFNFGATFASVVAIMFSISLYLTIPSPNDLLAEEVVSSHVRSLMVDHIADVASSDQHTVKPWFNGKLDFSPPVNDLATQGFPLEGGRLDYLDHRPVAALVYRHRLHLINVYIWPAANEQQIAAQTLSIHGYHLVHWIEGKMVYWVISDVDPRDLMTLTDILQAQAIRTPS